MINVHQLLQAHGLRPTKPRVVLMRFLQEQREHYTPYQMIESMRQHGNEFSIATLYQNLHILTDAGLLKRFVAPDGVARYDANLGDHHHLVCERCGRIVDVELSSPVAAQPTSHNESLEGWQVISSNVEFLGVCTDCQTNHS